MVDTVNDFEGTRPDVPNVAAICVYPLFVETVKQALTAQEVKDRVGCRRFSILTDIYGSQDRRNGHGRHARADEIDVVMNLGYFMEDLSRN